VSETPHSEEQLRCHYHPAEHAFVRCGACDKPLCAECVQHGPVGTRCIECLLGIVIRPLTRARRMGAALASMATALALGAGVGYLGMLSGPLGWLTSIGLGLAVGYVARTIVHHAAAPGVEAAAGIAAALGAYCGTVVWRAVERMQAGAPAGAAITAAARVHVLQWALIALLAAGAAIYWMRRR
jgi:hypothetical protein